MRLFRICIEQDPSMHMKGNAQLESKWPSLGGRCLSQVLQVLLEVYQSRRQHGSFVV